MNPTTLKARDGSFKREKVDTRFLNGEGTCPDCGKRDGTLHLDGCDQEDCPRCGGQLLGCDCEFAEHGVTLKGTVSGTGKKRSFTGWGFTPEEATAEAEALYKAACKRGLRKWIKTMTARADALDASAARLEAVENSHIAEASREKAAQIRERIPEAEKMIADLG